VPLHFDATAATQVLRRVWLPSRCQSGPMRNDQRHTRLEWPGSAVPIGSGPGFDLRWHQRRATASRLPPHTGHRPIVWLEHPRQRGPRWNLTPWRHRETNRLTRPDTRSVFPSRNHRECATWLPLEAARFGEPGTGPVVTKATAPAWCARFLPHQAGSMRTIRGNLAPRERCARFLPDQAGSMRTVGWARPGWAIPGRSRDGPGTVPGRLHCDPGIQARAARTPCIRIPASRGLRGPAGSVRLTRSSWPASPSTVRRPPAIRVSSTPPILPAKVV